MACSVFDPVGCVGDVARSVAGDAFSAIARDFGRAAAATVDWLWGQLSQASAVHLGGTGFHLDLAIVAAISGVVAVGLFAIQVVASALRRDPGGLGRAVKGLVVAFIAGGAAIGVTNALLSATDAVSAGVVRTAMGTDLAGMGRRILTGTAVLGVANPAGIILLAVAAIAASVIVWFALMVRKVLIVVSAVFAPIAFAGSLADITVSWTRRWIETMVALIASKLVLVVVFVVGWGVLDQGAGRAGHGGAQSVTQAAAGLVILAVAGLAPWMALKLVHFSGDQFHHLHALAASAAGGAGVAVSGARRAAAWAPVARAGAAGVTGAGAGAAGRVGGRAPGANAGRDSAGPRSATARPAGEAGAGGTDSPGNPSRTGAQGGDGGRSSGGGGSPARSGPAGTGAPSRAPGATGEPGPGGPPAPAASTPGRASASPRPARGRRHPRPRPPPPEVAPGTAGATATGCSHDLRPGRRRYQRALRAPSHQGGALLGLSGPDHGPVGVGPVLWRKTTGGFEE